MSKQSLKLRRKPVNVALDEAPLSAAEDVEVSEAQATDTTTEPAPAAKQGRGGVFVSDGEGGHHRR